jgi:hypothetical protein
MLSVMVIRPHGCLLAPLADMRGRVRPDRQQVLMPAAESDQFPVVLFFGFPIRQ